MFRLDGPVQPYAWGSRTFLAQLQGRRVPSATPEAELWLGAHPSAPSRAMLIDGPVDLDKLLEREPQGLLGDAVVRTHGPRLPYLCKLLAADEPLSLQVHPDADQARVGFERQLAGSFAVPTYTDPYPKPELLVAVTDFEALCGFRDPAKTADQLVRLGVAQLSPVIDALTSSGDPGSRLRTATEWLLALGASERTALVAAVAGSAEPLAIRLAAHYPGDIGVVVALLLNHLRLRPGEAVFMPAGNVHAYLCGAGVEVMGASDNVLRAGLTPKHVDPAELMRLVRYEVLAEPIFAATTLEPGLVQWQPPVSEFGLVRATSTPDAPVTLPGDGPRIVVCLRGTAQLSHSERDPASGEEAGVRLRPGEAAFVAAMEPPVVLSGEAEVFEAAPGC